MYDDDDVRMKIIVMTMLEWNSSLLNAVRRCIVGLLCSPANIVLDETGPTTRVFSELLLLLLLALALTLPTLSSTAFSGEYLYSVTLAGLPPASRLNTAIVIQGEMVGVILNWVKPL